SRNTSMSSLARGNPRRMVRRSGVVSSTSPRRRSVITRMRGRSGRSRLVIVTPTERKGPLRVLLAVLHLNDLWDFSSKRRDPRGWGSLGAATAMGTNISRGKILWGRSCLFLGLCLRVRRAQHHTAGEADAEDIKPALTEVEQVRIEQRGHDVIGHDQEPEPRDQRAVAKQSEVS